MRADIAPFPACHAERRAPARQGTRNKTAGSARMEPVKFVALDRDDLEVVSTHLQDALVKVDDIVWRPQEKQLVVSSRRFDWLSAEGGKPELARRHSGLL